MNPKETIPAFDAFLAAEGLRFEGVVIGGTALGLLGVITRHTRDCDILHPELPADIAQAALRFAQAQRLLGDTLNDDWLNNGPASLMRDLPQGWAARLVPAFVGKAMTLSCLGRLDLLRSKLFALCDRGIDLPDCLALAPTSSELAELEPWLAERDSNPQWTAHVREVLGDLGRRVGLGV
jgi:hypothetical protein